MKITNMIMTPVALVADAVTFGEAGMTRSIIEDEREERLIRALKELNKNDR